VNRLILSAPFGNYLNFAGCTPTLGTYTLHRRAGTIKRWWRVLSTLRPTRVGWVNKLGLPNPGIGALKQVPAGAILSVHGFDAGEWVELVVRAASLGARVVEFNLSCPNVPVGTTAREVIPAVRKAAAGGVTVLAKLPPLRWAGLALPLLREGVTAFHCCNTVPTPRGGLSGKVLKQFSLCVVEGVRRHLPTGGTVIGGGGITTPGDIADYASAGATHFAVGSYLLNPLHWRHVRHLARAAQYHGGDHVDATVTPALGAGPGEGGAGPGGADVAPGV
jgi:dihydroorotate dehydrogenase